MRADIDHGTSMASTVKSYRARFVYFLRKSRSRLRV